MGEPPWEGILMVAMGSIVLLIENHDSCPDGRQLHLEGSSEDLDLRSVSGPHLNSCACASRLGKCDSPRIQKGRDKLVIRSNGLIKCADRNSHQSDHK